MTYTGDSASYPKPDSWPACVPVGFRLFPVQGANRYLGRSRANTFSGAAGLTVIYCARSRNQASNGFAATSDHNLLTLLDPVE